jgi:hypothetical protein
LSASDVGNALGKYITGQSVTSDMVTIINQAIAFAGPAPVPGQNGNPPGFNEVTTGGQFATNPVTGLKQIQEGVTGSDIAWNSSSGATSYTVTTTKGTASLLGSTSARIHDINTGKDRGDQATVTVLAQPAASGAQPAQLVVHTKR